MPTIVTPTVSTNSALLKGVAAGSGASAAGQVPPGIIALPAGTVLRGDISQIDGRGNAVLSTLKGDVSLHTDLAIKLGSEVSLRLTSSSQGLKARILSINGMSPQEFSDKSNTPRGQQIHVDDVIQTGKQTAAANVATQAGEGKLAQTPVNVAAATSVNVNIPTETTALRGLLLSRADNLPQILQSLPSSISLPIQRLEAGAIITVKLVQNSIQLPQISTNQAQITQTGQTQQPPTTTSTPQTVGQSAPTTTTATSATTNPAAQQISAQTTIAGGATNQPAATVATSTTTAPASPNVTANARTSATNVTGQTNTAANATPSPTQAVPTPSAGSTPAQTSAANPAAPNPTTAASNVTGQQATQQPTAATNSAAPNTQQAASTTTQSAQITAQTPSAATPVATQATSTTPTPATNTQTTTTNAAPQQTNATPISPTGTTTSTPTPQASAATTTTQTAQTQTTTTTPTQAQTPAANATTATNPTATASPTSTVNQTASTNISPNVATTTTPPATQSATASPAQLAQGQLPAQVIGHEQSGETVVKTALGVLKISIPSSSGAAATSLPVGTTFNLQIENISLPQNIGSNIAAQINSAPAPLSELSMQWRSLQESVEIIAQSHPAMAAQIIDAVIPKPGAKMATATLFFLSALRGGDIGKWLGEKAIKTLEQNQRGDLVRKLTSEFGTLRQFFIDSPSPNWQAAFVPVYQNEEWQQARMFLKKEPDNSTDEEAGGVRFIMEVDLSRMGPMQFDGLIRKRGEATSFDLIIRSRDALSSNDRQNIRDIYQGSSEITGLNGGISFQVTTPFPVLPMRDILSDAPDVMA